MRRLESGFGITIGLLIAVLLFNVSMNPSVSQGERGDPVSNCLEKGDIVGVFYVTKVAGANDDGVEEGQELCYRCRYGSRPIVMVFTREPGGKVPQLVEELDKTVNKNKSSKLKGLVTLVGGDAERATLSANRIAEKSGAKYIPIVVAKETKTGPVNYKLNPKDDVTVVVARDSQVVTTHTYSADKINIAAVLGDVNRVLH